MSTPTDPGLNLRRIDLLSLQLLLECAARGSISAAARHCHLSVMGASERLRRLEESLGQPLFHRRRHGLEPTAAGQAAIRAAATALRSISCMLRELRAMAPEARPAANTGRRGSAGADAIASRA